MTNFRLNCIADAILHQELSGIWMSDSIEAEVERQCAADAFSEVDQTARRQRQITPWTRGVLDC